MKKILIFILSITFTIALTSCTNNSESNVNKETGNTATETENAATVASDLSKEWGISDSIVTENEDGVLSRAYIRLPEVASMMRGPGRVATQNDETLILMCGQHLEQSPEVKDMTDVLNAYKSQPIDVLSKYRRWGYDNFDFTVEKSEITEINGYTMCKYNGTHTFTYEGTKGSMNFAAYATQLHTNGAYVYWIVIDESKDQSQSDKINDYAEKMAYSLGE